MTITGEDLATYSGGQIPAGEDADKLVAGVLDAVRRYCGWQPYGERRETLILDGSGTQLQQMPSCLVRDVHSVWVDDEELPASAFRWSAAGMLTRRVGIWPGEFRCVEVDLTHGEDVEDVRLLVLQVAARSAANPMGYGNESVGAMSFGHGGTSFFDDEYARLDAYRVVVD